MAKNDKPDDKSGKDGKQGKDDKPDKFVTEITPRSQDFSAGTWTSSAARSWPITRRSKGAWSSGRTVTPSGN